MVMPNFNAVQTVSSEVISKGMSVDGRSFVCSKVRYNREIPGVGAESFVIDVSGSANEPAVTLGFASKEDAERFAKSSKAEEYLVADMYGNPTEETRVGLSVPEGMITYYGDHGPKVINAVRSPAASSPPSDAGKPPTGQQEGGAVQSGASGASTDSGADSKPKDK